MATEQEYEDKVEEPVNGTTTLYRPVGQEELNLIRSSDYREFPPRLPHQPIFYPVLKELPSRPLRKQGQVQVCS